MSALLTVMVERRAQFQKGGELQLLVSNSDPRPVSLKRFGTEYHHNNITVFLPPVLTVVIIRMTTYRPCQGNKHRKLSH